LDPKPESDSESAITGVYYNVKINSRSKLEQGQREAEDPASCGRWSDQRWESRQAGRQAGRQGSGTRANGCIDPEAEEGQVSARLIPRQVNTLEYTILNNIARNTT